MTEDKRQWREQYELLVKILMDENTRYWTRFTVSLLINGGLIIAFSSFVGYMSESLNAVFGFIGIILIAIVGIIFSKLWLKITLIANQWLKFYHDTIKNIEADHIEESLRMHPQKEGVIHGSITKTAVWYSKIFIGVWSILLITAVLLGLLQFMTI